MLNRSWNFLVGLRLINVLIGVLVFFMLSAVNAANDEQLDTKLLIVGDSLSAAYGIEQQQGWVTLLQQRVKKERIPLTIINSSISGDTTAGGLARLPSLLQREQPQWVLIELGGNDGLRGLPTQTMESNLTNMMVQIKKNGAQPLLIGIKIPPNYGKKYTTLFEQVYVTVAEQQQVPLLPFLLEGVAGDERYMQSDRLHPNAQAQPIILERVWAFLQQRDQLMSITDAN